MEVAIELNDRGRLEVGERLGPELVRVDGRLTAVSDSQYVLQVSQVRDIGGNVTKWSGETVRLRQDYAKQVLQRRTDKRRTSILVAGVSVVLGAFIGSRGLLGGGDGEPGNGKEPPGSGNGQ
jgi:hypothetical protein